jgi:anti-sigma regulatory factor (Ser/Thr protein kinase)
VPAAEPPTGQPVGHWLLRADPTSARLARRLVAQALDGADENLRRRMALVTSELVGNSVRHARGGMSVELHDVGDGWVVVVADDSSAPPVVRPDDHLAENGRGMLIVQRVSEALGWARTPTGKVVWAHLVPGTD